MNILDMKKLLSLPLILKNLYMKKKIKKRDFEFEAYPIGTPVYAISIYHNYGKATDHIAIYQAVVEDVRYSETDGVEYYLESKSGNSWSDVIKAEHVSEDMDDLIDVAKNIWGHEV